MAIYLSYSKHETGNFFVKWSGQEICVLPGAFCRILNKEQNVIAGYIEVTMEQLAALGFIVSETTGKDLTA